MIGVLIRMVGRVHRIRIVVASCRCMMIVWILGVVVHHSWGWRTTITVVLIPGWVHWWYPWGHRGRTNPCTAIRFHVPTGDGWRMIAVGTIHCGNAADYWTAEHIILTVVGMKILKWPSSGSENFSILSKTSLAHFSARFSLLRT